MKTTAESLSTDVFIKMVISSWETQNKRVTKLLDTLSDERLLAETAPGRNRGIYLIGHLTAVSDGMFPILGWGERLYPELEAIFVKQPDKALANIPSMQQVRSYWTAVNERINKSIAKMNIEDWFSKHTLVSEEDFAKEPHRNKLNLFINRTNHHSYHLGQLVYLDPRKDGQ